MPGDVLCLMQGKWDPRGSKASVRPEHVCNNYLDRVVEDAADFFAPYAKNIVCIGVGNHEAAIAKRYESHPTDRMIGLINAKTKASVYNGGFSCFVRFSFTEHISTRGLRVIDSVLLHADHGYGGGGPVTQDMVQHNRRAVYLPDADIVISGHVHRAWTAEIARKRVTLEGRVYQDIQTHIKLPTYKEEYKDGFGGWHAETGKEPRPLGGWWLRFHWSARHSKIAYEVIRAR